MQQVNPNAAGAQPREAVWRDAFAVFGSLWFAGLLLMLLVVGMACATVFESARGTEQVLAVFYGSGWFKALFALLGVNIFASVALRYPFTRKHVGFVLTHGGLLVIMTGAIVTLVWGIDGQLSVTEGQTVDAFQVRRDMLTLLDRRDQTRTQLELTDGAFGGFVAAEIPHAPTLRKGDLAIEVVRYLPDSTAVERIVDDNPRYQPAIEVSLSVSAAESKWIFVGQSVALGPVTASYRVARDATELGRLLAAAEAATDASSVGRISITSQGETSEIAVEDCIAEAVPVGDTDLSVRVLRYLPHAIVGADRRITSASDKPVNPAVEVELTGPAGAERRVCFAQFPDFQSMHGKTAAPEVKLIFHATQATAPTAPLEIIGGPAGRAFARFTKPGLAARTQELEPGAPVSTPWGNHKLTLFRRFEHARIDRPLEPVDPVRKNRMPAVLLKLTTAKHTSAMWVQRGVPRSVSVNGAPHEILYGDKTVPLGFTLKLDDFKVLHYPGGRQPRSFASNITVANPATGDLRERIVSMNHPVKYGGFTLYQSSYREGSGPAMSVLSVSRDPGKLLVFAGYILTTLGMVVVLNNRLRERRLMAQYASAAKQA